MRRVAALAAVRAALAAAGCGGGGAVAWDGHPRSGPVAGGQLLFGRVVNRSDRPLRLRAGEVRVLDAAGRALPASAAFSGGFNPAIALRGYGAEMFASATAGVGGTATLAPGATAPLSVSWTGTARAIEVAGTRLALK
jgi:hypothetical protein